MKVDEGEIVTMERDRDSAHVWEQRRQNLLVD